MAQTPRITTISAKSPLPNTRNVSSSRATVSIARQNMTPELAKDPKTVSKAFGDMQETLARASEAARSNPYNAVHILKNVALKNGVQVDLVHCLGVPWQRAEVVQCHIGSRPMQLVEVASPNGANKSTTCSVIPYGSASIAGGVKLVGGTAIVTALPNGYDFVGITMLSPSGTIGYQYKVSASLLVKGAFVITSLNSAGTINAADVSTVSYMFTKMSSGNFDIMISG